jgi:methylated-DNA-[protein]-cysteine S-methyltransferase
MAGRGYTIFDTSVGRCGIAWSQTGIVGVRLPEAREIETRRLLLQQFPEAREARPPEDVELAIEGIAALLRGTLCALSDATLDMAGISPFHRRVYDTVRLIPHGQTRTYAELAARLGASGAVHAVGQAINRNPFAILVPCHRTLVAANQTGGFAGNGGIVSKVRLLSIEGALADRGPTLMDAVFAVAPPRAPG